MSPVFLCYILLMATKEILSPAYSFEKQSLRALKELGIPSERTISIALSASVNCLALLGKFFVNPLIRKHQERMCDYSPYLTPDLFQQHIDKALKETMKLATPAEIQLDKLEESRLAILVWNSNGHQVTDGQLEPLKFELARLAYKHQPSGEIIADSFSLCNIPHGTTDIQPPKESKLTRKYIPLNSRIIFPFS